MSEEQSSTGIELDGKTYSPGEIKELVQKAAQAEEMITRTKPFTTVAERYQVEPEEFVSQAERALQLIPQLIEHGIITENGEINLKREARRSEEPPVISAKPKDVSNTELNELSTKVAEMVETIENLRNDNTKLVRLELRREIQKRYPELSDEDVSKLIVKASTERTKPVFDLAKEAVVEKTRTQEELRARFAKEFGIDLAKFDANKIREPGPEGGLGSKFKGKKIVLTNRKIEKGQVSTRDAVREYLNNKLGE